MIKVNDDTGTPEILGYDKGKYFETWVDFDSIDYDGNADLGGFPTKTMDQYGQPPAALHVSGELQPLETYLAPPSRFKNGQTLLILLYLLCPDNGSLFAHFAPSSLPALPSPKSWSHLQEYTVVSNEVFQKLKELNITLEGDCEISYASILHEDEMFLWLPKDNKLWCIPISCEELSRRSDCYLMFANEFATLERIVAKVKLGDKARNEARCVVALARKTDGAHLGYYCRQWYNAWISLGGRRLDYVTLLRPF
ncbi:hypothetical protein FOQG_19608 [Fusarium oxysporum f. sp. raphani 54005]|uniref:Uncharacterized protein n=1 Tax=Fusarium oxysporum f. sp. raphani 54005 TaxID=1089458 RepID=X0B0I0_FUSOX|nr:hypothetical protein FOQG_19608 [Fusarium oxysporum f. sp. raphani 54005]